MNYSKLRIVFVLFLLVGVIGIGCSSTNVNKSGIPVVKPMGDSNSNTSSNVNEPVYYEDQGSDIVLGYPIHKYIFSNGLRMIILEDHSGPNTASTYLAYGTGTVNETAATAGLAHLTEHAMYTGTADVPAGQHDEIIKGMSTSNIKTEPNAYTRTEYTLYYSFNIPVKLNKEKPFENLETALKLEADRMRGLTFNSDAIEMERNRLLVEEQNSFSLSLLADSMLRTSAFTMHPYRLGACYNAFSNARNLTLEDIKDFYDKYYQPNNAVLVILGDVDTDRVAKIANRYLGKIKPGKYVPRKRIREPEQLAERRTVLKVNQSKTSQIYMGYKVPGYRSPDGFALKLLSFIYNQRVRSKFGENSDTSYYANFDTINDPKLDTSLFKITGNFPASNSVYDAGNDMINMLVQFKTEPVTSQELESSRQQLVGFYEFLQANAERPYFSIGAEIAVQEILGSYGYTRDIKENVDRVTPEDIIKVANKYFNPEARTIVIIKGNPDYKPVKMGVNISQTQNGEAGVLITAVQDNSPAKKAGMQAKDIVVNVENTALFTINDLMKVLSNYKPGDVIKVKVMRNGEEKELNLTLEEMPQMPAHK